MNNRRILIANLAKGAIGEQAANLLGSVLVSRLRREVPRLFTARGILPFEVTGHRHEAAPLFERFTKEWLRRYRLDARVEGGQAQFLEGFAPPEGDKPQRITSRVRWPSCSTIVSTGSVGQTLKLSCMLGIAAGRIS